MAEADFICAGVVLCEALRARRPCLSSPLRMGGVLKVQKNSLLQRTPKPIFEGFSASSLSLGRRASLHLDYQLTSVGHGVDVPLQFSFTKRLPPGAGRSEHTRS